MIRGRPSGQKPCRGFFGYTPVLSGICIRPSGRQGGLHATPMLQIKQICKQYRTGDLIQQALDHVNLSFRDNEFVAILGPSGSGKTTLLNIIGGLDRYDSGDLIINGVSTKKYTDRDWDTYRNHTVGFIFQSYNLIPHQTILANVELTLTVSGISRAERRRRAIEALEKVGLGKHRNKHPNQLSGGQMQRVAIARALVNDPDVLLADEPTGALDSETSIQVMELLKEVARDRLVIMVTHNPELADKYATRIVRLTDGVIRADTDPYTPPEAEKEPVHKKWARRSSMSFLTALALSFQNLRSKKARTLLTAFAGSIGIIGIALILSLSTGVNQYIESVEEDTLSEYPLSIQSASLDMAGMMASMMDQGDGSKPQYEVNVIDMITQTFSKIGSNDLASLKTYLESGESGIEGFTKAVEYSYNVQPQIYLLQEDSYRQVNPDTSFAPLGLGSTNSSNSMMSSMVSTDVFYQMPEDTALYEDQYTVKAGRWPENSNECVLVLTGGGSISDFLIYTLGLRPGSELDHMVEQFAEEETVTVPDDITGYSYDDILGITFKLVNAADYYEYDDEYNVWTDKSDNKAYMLNLVKNGEDLTIVGIVQPDEDAAATMLSPGINYPASLTKHIMEAAANSEIVRQQLANPGINVFTGDPFGEESDEERLDLADLFTVDEGAMRDAFTFDADALQLDMGGAFDFSDMTMDPSQFEGMDLSGMDFSGMDLSGMDLSGMDLSGLDLSGMNLGQMDLSAMLSHVKFNVTQEQLSTLAQQLLDGYKVYAADHPEMDFTRLDEYFCTYLQSPEACQVMADALDQVLEESGLTLSAQQLEELVTNVMSGYRQWIISQGYDDSDPEAYRQYLAEYLGTEEAQKMLADGAAEIIASSKDKQITPEQLEFVAQQVLQGYQDYAQTHNMTDPARVGDYLLAYLQTDAARSVIAEGVAGMVDTSELNQWLGSQMAGAQQQIQSQMQQAMTQLVQQIVTQIMQQVMPQVMNQFMSQMMPALGQTLETRITSGMEDAMAQLEDSFKDAFNVDAEAFGNAITVNMSEEELSELLMSLMTSQSTTYDGNLQALGYASPDEPGSISIYPINFEAKEKVLDILDGYNARMEGSGQEEKVITYTDLVGTLMSSVTDIINIISYVLVAFVAISLVVSSIMIGVITYISVLERKKEIGILRAIGASKGNISQVFNAETFMIGLAAGLIGIGCTLLLLIPGNMLIHHLANSNEVNAVLPVGASIILVLLSVILTLLGGLIPSRKAAKQDPVTALRTE